MVSSSGDIKNLMRDSLMVRYWAHNPGTDYAWPEKKIYIEVDGEQHYTEAGLEHDRIRTEILMNEGWKLLKRIRWSEYQKLSKLEKEKEVYRLLQSIKIQEENF